MPAKTNTVTARPSDGEAFLAKAREFLDAADDAIERENFTAAVGNAVHATVAASDAVASVRLKARWKGEHAGAAGHVSAAGVEGDTCAKCLRRVLPLKNQAEYDPAPVAPSKAVAAVRTAHTAVEAAERVAAEP
jgi:hypothetical protein